MMMSRSARERPLVISSFRSLRWISRTGSAPRLSSRTSISRTSLLLSVSNQRRERETTPTALASLAIFSNSGMDTFSRWAISLFVGERPSSASRALAAVSSLLARERTSRGAPVHRAEFVEDGAADSGGAVCFEFDAAIEVEGVDGVHEPENAGGHEVV